MLTPFLCVLILKKKKSNFWLWELVQFQLRILKTTFVAQKCFFLSFQGTVATFYRWDGTKKNCLCQIFCTKNCSYQFIFDWVTHACTFNGPFPRLPRWAGTRKVNQSGFTEARDSEWQCHQLGHMQVCISLQTDNDASTPPLSFYRPDALSVA